MERAGTFKFTVESLDDPRIAELKKEIAGYNKVVRDRVRSGEAVVKTWNNKPYPLPMSLLRVRIMPRGPRTVPSKTDYPQIKSGRAYDCYLPQRHGTHFDVYVNEDSPNNHVLDWEMKTGLTPGQQRKVGKAMDAVRKLEFEVDQQLRAAGITWEYVDGQKTHMSIEKKREGLRQQGVSEDIIERLT